MEPKTLIADLVSLGWTQSQIAAIVGVGQAQISRLAIGIRAEMRSGNWERLKALHATGNGPNHIAIPTEKAA